MAEEVALIIVLAAYLGWKFGWFDFLHREMDRRERSSFNNLRGKQNEPY